MSQGMGGREIDERMASRATTHSANRAVFYKAQGRKVGLHYGTRVPEIVRSKPHANMQDLAVY